MFLMVWNFVYMGFGVGATHACQICVHPPTPPPQEGEEEESRGEVGYWSILEP